MAIIKISELPAADTPLSASDVVPALQNGVTKKTAIDQFGFLPAGTNAVTRTIQNKLRESVSIKDFGAVGDGVTDDTAAIQTACIAAVDKTLIFPAGTYLVSNIVFPANVTCQFLRGAVIVIPDGVTVSFYSQPEAGRYKIFDIVGADANPANWGDVRWADNDSAPTVSYANTVCVYPEWWGAITATTISTPDSTEAFRKCFRSYKPVTSATRMPHVIVEGLGQYIISNTIYIHTSYSFVGQPGVKTTLMLNTASSAFTGLRIGGYLLNGTTPTVDPGSAYPTVEISNIWFQATGANVLNANTAAIALVEETGVQNVAFSININCCWFLTFKGINFQRQVGDSVIERCWFDDANQEGITLAWPSTTNRPIAGGLTIAECSFLSVSYAIKFDWWSHLIVSNNRFYLGTSAYAKAIRCDERSAAIQIVNNLFYTFAGNAGTTQYALYTSARIDDLLVDGNIFERIASVIYKDGLDAQIFGTFSNNRLFAISKESITEDATAKNSLGNLQIANNTWLSILDRPIVLTSRCEVLGNAFLDVLANPPGTSASTGGTFTLTFSGQTTSGIAYNASAATVQTALETLSSIGAGNVAVTGSAGAFTIEMIGAFATLNTALMTGDGASLTPASGLRILKSQIGNGSINTRFQLEYAQIPTIGVDLANIVISGAAAGGASGSRVESNDSRIVGWLTASYKQSSLGNADLNNIVSANNRGAYNTANISWDYTAIYAECTRSRLSNEGIIIKAWDNYFDSITTAPVQTVNATPANLVAGAAYHNGTHVYMSAMISAKDLAGVSVENALYRVDGAFKRESNSTTLLNNTTTNIFEATAGMDAQLTVGSNAGAQFVVTGVAATNIRWVAKITSVLM